MVVFSANGTQGWVYWAMGGNVERGEEFFHMSFLNVPGLHIFPQFSPFPPHFPHFPPFPPIFPIFPRERCRVER